MAMKKIFKKIILDFHSSPLPDFKTRELDIPLDLKKIITLVGPRRAGKTWYFFQIMARLMACGVSKQQILYINFEDERLGIESDYDVILHAYLELYPDQPTDKIYIFFDEIQELPGWEKYVRRLYDKVTRNIFLTGSNAKMLSMEIATSLRGRSLSFEILPLSFSEFLSFRGIDASDRYSTRNSARISASLQDYLVWGGFPELVNIEPRFKVAILQEYFNVMLYRDLVERYQIKDPSLVKFILKRLISSFTREFSINKLFNDIKSRGIKTGRETVYRIAHQIFSIYMAASVEKYDLSVIKREMSNRKIYLYDNGLASAIHYAFSDDYGKLLENLVFIQLRRKTREIYFLKNSYECDFAVFSADSPPMLIQVTDRLHEGNIKREIKGLLKASDRISDAKKMMLFRTADIPANDMGEDIQFKSVTDWLLE